MSSILEEIGLSYDDVLIRPEHSKVTSRTEVKLNTNLVNKLHSRPAHPLRMPLVGANMDSVSSPKMLEAFLKVGGVTILHRYQSQESIIEIINKYKGSSIPSIGTRPGEEDKAVTYESMGAEVICIDVAHGDHISVLNMIEFLKSKTKLRVIAGNVATKSGAYALARAGADCIKVGIGNGKACRTQTVTGAGVPQLTSVMECAKVKDAYDITIMADGGITSSGDCVKALGAGADTVMIGSLISGTDECPSLSGLGPTVYRGMSSHDARLDGGLETNRAPEGVTMLVEPKGPVGPVLENLVWGIRSGLSYVGARTIQQLQQKVVFVRRARG